MRKINLGTQASEFLRQRAAAFQQALGLLKPGGLPPPLGYLVLGFCVNGIFQSPRRCGHCFMMASHFGDWPRERSSMYIYGTSQIHAAQPLNPPHRLTPTHSASGSYSSAGVDQLDISPEADFVAQARDLPEIRESRVAALREQIQNGTYETAEKLDVALSRLLDEIA